MKKLLIALLLLFPTLSYGMSIELQQSVISNSTQYLKVREITPNRSPDIDRFHRYLGIPYGNSWCMLLVQTEYKEGFALKGLTNPLPKDARVSRVWKAALKNPYRYKCIRAKRLALGIEKGEPADVVIMSHGKTSEDANWSGHTGILLTQLEKALLLVREGNTSSGDRGSQANGDGCYDRIRKLNIGKKFQIEGLIRVK